MILYNIFIFKQEVKKLLNNKIITLLKLSIQEYNKYYFDLNEYKLFRFSLNKMQFINNSTDNC